MKVIAITGTSSFIGQHLVQYLSSLQGIEMRLLVHSCQPHLPAGNKSLRFIQGDLLKPQTLSDFLTPDCLVIHLAYLHGASDEANLKAASNLAEACVKAHVKRLVHCSTAVVAGKTSDNPVTEETKCEPGNSYEYTKYKMERLFTKEALDHFDLAILRPTAVFGMGGKNLLKLADDLTMGSRILNYLKSCLFDHRCMNLVSVTHVINALTFLAFAQTKQNCGIYIVSDDDHPLNNYRDIERRLMHAFGVRDYRLPRIPLPQFLLAVLLKLAGKSNTHPFRTYSAGKLRKAGLGSTDSFGVDLTSFTDWYKSRGTDSVIKKS
ncbi:MAG TPA: NAD(P)-dependent oxidoreductase [Smithellaceae bacterium]|nr:NAD(P)-dependent oxidoreductase [Smithellaceae bacterium]HPL67654.1 NAD(P)-dependent oxidoreductase [Smithellaceae bacterium]